MNLKSVQKRVLAEFEERGIRDKQLNDGVQIEVAKTKYWVKHDGEGTAKIMQRLNITRLFEELLKSKHCPYETKKSLAEDLNNAAAKKWLAQNVCCCPLIAPSPLTSRTFSPTHPSPPHM